MKTYCIPLRAGICRSPEFEKKGLAAFAVNVGLKCGHGCTYCSTGTVLRTHPGFRDIGRSPFETGYAVVDPCTVARVARDARFKRNRGLVQLCTTTDAWSPEAHEYDLGRDCLGYILAEPGWTVRILTKNAAVSRDFNVVERYRDRVLVGISLTATSDRTDVMSVVEPHASPLRDRFAAMREAHARGLRTYAMLCPLLPGIADSPEQIDELIRFAVEIGAEEVFTEAVNGRGPGLRLTEEALRARGYDAEAAAVAGIRREAAWSTYAARLIQNLQRSARSHGVIDRLRVLLYPSRLAPSDLAALQADDEGVVWL